MPVVNPAILKWARETAGLTLEEAAKAVNLNDTKTATGAERLALLEQGEEEPSRNLLLRMSKQYHRPLLVFYLNAPPPTGNHGHDFRTLPENILPIENSRVNTLIRDIQVRQNIIRSVLEEENASPIPYIHSKTIEDGIIEIANDIKTAIGFDLQTFRKKTQDQRLSYVRNRIESIGIFVLFLNDLGSYHSAIPVEAFRGFTIADPIAPFIVVNHQDAKTAQVFTIFHEVTHLWLGTTGISTVIGNSPIERFCNDVASEILLPSNENFQISINSTYTFEQLYATIENAASELKLSATMIAYICYRKNFISEQQWLDLLNYFRTKWQEYKLREKENKTSESGPSYYKVLRYRLGEPLLNLVNRSLNDGTLTPTKASKVLGVKPSAVMRFLDNS